LAQTDHAARLLNRRLREYRNRSSKLRPQFAKAYGALVARLESLDRGEVGPKVGEPLPHFHLPDTHGKLVSLGALLQRGPLVISINRGHWCPYCKLELRSLAAIHQEIEKLGANIVSIIPERAEFANGVPELSTLPFPILCDVDLGYALMLGLVYGVGDEVNELYEDVGIELDRYQGNLGYLLPMAAKFIVDQDGLVRARQVNVEFRERMEPDDIIAALRRLHKNR
jgi:peroxiredoxin